MGEKVLCRIVDREEPAKLTLNETRRIIDEGIERQAGGCSLKGKKIGVLMGSRGIRNILEIVKQVVKSLKDRGADVVILPAMGSHGGATSEGQKAILAGYGITEENAGAPVFSGMEVEQVGDVNGHPVYVDRNALAIDAVVPVNRIKAHTDFHGPYESGIVKIIAIGMGKRHQAEVIHRYGVKGLLELIPAVARVVLQRVPLFAGVAILENKFDETAVVEVLFQDNLFSREQELLVLSKTLLPKMPFDRLDVLVVSEIGKNISGVGIDPNVTKRMRILGVPDEPSGPGRIVALDLTDASGGNALGMGIADVITQRLYDKVDLKKTYINTITSGFLERCFVPVVMPTDEEAVGVALQTCGRAVDWHDGRIVFIRNTLALSEMYISAALLPEVPASFAVDPGLVAKVFQDNGSLALTWY